MDEQTLNTVGRLRTECIEKMKILTRNYDPNAYEYYNHLHGENERYYDSLNDGSLEKEDLTNKFNILSKIKNEKLHIWKKKYDDADVITRQGLIENMKMDLWWYEKERAAYAETNYLYFKTYWEDSNQSDSIE